MDDITSKLYDLSQETQTKMHVIGDTYRRFFELGSLYIDDPESWALQQTHQYVTNEASGPQQMIYDVMMAIGYDAQIAKIKQQQVTERYMRSATWPLKQDSKQ